MINVILINNPALRDVLVSSVSGIRQTNESHDVIFYQKNNYIFAFSDKVKISELFAITLEEYQPEKIFFAETARSVDVDHEVGDIVLPNVFMNFNEKILTTDLTNENRDSLMGEAQFLEIFEEQKDYFVEDFGLSIGGILVDNVPLDADAEKLLMVYEADVYSEKNFTEIYKLANNEIMPVTVIIGITQGKISQQHFEKNPLMLVAENIMTTVRMMNEDE